MLNDADYKILERILNSTDKKATVQSDAFVTIDGETFNHHMFRIYMVMAVTNLGEEGNVTTIEVNRTGRAMLTNREFESQVLSSLA